MCTRTDELSDGRVHAVNRFFCTFMSVEAIPARKGFGELIAKARVAAGLTPEELADRLGYRSKSVVYRLESEGQEPDVALVNGLVANLPISAEALLRAMGVHLSLPLAARVPRPLAEFLGSATMEQQQALMLFLGSLVANGRDRR